MDTRFACPIEPASLRFRLIIWQVTGAAVLIGAVTIASGVYFFYDSTARLSELMSRANRVVYRSANLRSALDGLRALDVDVKLTRASVPPPVELPAQPPLATPEPIQRSFGSLEIVIMPARGFLRRRLQAFLEAMALVDLLVLAAAWLLARALADRAIQPLERAARERAQIDRALSERMQAVDEMRQFIADAGHQLRTPLTVSIGYISSLEPQSPREAEMIAKALEQSRRMRTTINGLIALARYGSEDPPLYRIDLGVLASNVVRLFQEAGHERVSLATPSTEAFVEANTAELFEALSAVVDNALKYAPSGPIVVRVECGGGRCAIRVEDAGSGMSDYDMARAFDRFYRGTAAGNPTGSGLGLAIVKRCVERSGGTVLLCNVPGSGLRCEFAFNAA